MGTQLDACLPPQEPKTTQQDLIISSWFDLDDEFLQQELQDLENHLFDLETDPVSFSSLPIQEGSPFMLDLYNDDINAPQAGVLQPRPNDQPILPVQQCVEPDVRDTFLNGSEFGLISPTDLSPDINNNINDNQFCETMISGLMNPLGNVEISEPMITMTNATDEDGTDDDEDRANCKQGTLNSKNMVSERNRRKRLSKQLLSLRALVPNITKMDKRSVLVDALSYLRKIHEEIELLQKEIKEHQTGPKLNDFRETSQDAPFGTLGIPHTASASVTYRIPKAHITEIDIEKIEDKRFIVKITCEGGVGVRSDVLRVFESLDFEITYAALQQLQPQVFLVTIFVRVKKQWKMTEQKLKYSITSMASRTGLTLSNP
ncbi:hypothetical protein AQUCO_00100269v1 [Aquilegia coerulea]|uniref:BHLH domain-containing protein n=1 Tax=Aquilegia coerulea TaxID=218851 RepID=A0A2G5F9M3_AQUCA|nr:hypothetical protein AQUCO_00100269v1 [Aquilegia coerulea]